ncbi:MAG: pilus assembly protein [Rhodospirillales bacterium]|jgi:Flp pilus assembly protein TadG|nr:pilus assembly protein [Rhodospirillales bacterium]
MTGSFATWFRSDRRGSTALEFALVGGLLVLLLIAPVELGLMIWTGGSLETVAAQTARCAAIGSCSDPAAYAVDLASKWIGAGAIAASDVTVTATTSCDNATGTFERVTITSSIWQGAFITPLSGATQVAAACFPT